MYASLVPQDKPETIKHCEAHACCLSKDDDAGRATCLESYKGTDIEAELAKEKENAPALATDDQEEEPAETATTQDEETGEEAPKEEEPKEEEPQEGEEDEEDEETKEEAETTEETTEEAKEETEEETTEETKVVETPSSAPTSWGIGSATALAAAVAAWSLIN